MKVINTATGETVAEITTNHSMSIDNVIELMDWKIDGEGFLYDENGSECIAHYYDLKMEY